MFSSLRVAFQLGYKSVVRGNRASVILLICILALEFVNLVFVASLLRGILVTIDTQVRTVFVSDIVVEPGQASGTSEFISQADSLLGRIRSVPGVEAAAPQYRLQGSVSFEKPGGSEVARSAEVVGIDPERESGVSGVPKTLTAGRYLESTDTDAVILGNDIAGDVSTSEDPNSLGGVAVGDRVTVTFGNGVRRELEVVGLFRTRFAFVDASAFVSTKTAEAVLGTSDSAGRILVKLAPGANPKTALAAVRVLDPALTYKQWSDYVGVVGDLSDSLNMIATVIGAIGMVVAAITIFVILYVNVVQKRRQIGIVKAIGIDRSTVLGAYLLQALFYAVTGSGLGLAAYHGIVIPYFNTHPMALPIGNVRPDLDAGREIVSIASLFGAAIIGGLIPAWRGARENIIKAIWGTG